MMKRSKGDRLFNIIIVALLVVLLIVELYPLYYVLIASISNPQAVNLNEVWLYPKQITFEGYTNIFKNKDIWTGYGNSLFYTVAGTFTCLLFTLTCAYCMARQPAFKGKTAVTWFLIFTCYFGGGLIPYYLLIRDIGWIDNRMVMIVPGALSVFNMIIVRTFYQNTIPASLYESARIDGSGDFSMFLRITLPLSKPIIAVMALFFAVGQWNSFFGALIFLPSPEKQPLQLVLRNILIEGQMLNNIIDLNSMSTSQLQTLVKKQWMAETMKYAIIYIASIPVLIAYPFVQKYFVQGVMIGAIKG